MIYTSMKFRPILYSMFLYKMGQDFLVIRYDHSQFLPHPGHEYGGRLCLAAKFIYLLRLLVQMNVLLQANIYQAFKNNFVHLLDNCVCIMTVRHTFVLMLDG